VVATKEWFLPPMSCMKMAQYAALSNEDKLKLYELSFTNYQQIHHSTRFSTALNVSKDRLAKFLKRTKPAEDRLKTVALQKWYLEQMANLPGPDQQDTEDYFNTKSSMFAYTFHSLADQLRLARKEAADLIITAFEDHQRFIGEITGTLD
jgi:hypothetical protein